MEAMKIIPLLQQTADSILGSQGFKALGAAAAAEVDRSPLKHWIHRRGTL
jgi:hypothetical protein